MSSYLHLQHGTEHKSYALTNNIEKPYIEVGAYKLPVRSGGTVSGLHIGVGDVGGGGDVRVLEYKSGTYYTTAAESAGLTDTTALTRSSTSGESYETRSSTSGTSYLTSENAGRYWYKDSRYVSDQGRTVYKTYIFQSVERWTNTTYGLSTYVWDVGTVTYDYVWHPQAASQPICTITSIIQYAPATYTYSSYSNTQTFNYIYSTSLYYIFNYGMLWRRYGSALPKSFGTFSYTSINFQNKNGQIIGFAGVFSYDKSTVTTGTSYLTRSSTSKTIYLTRTSTSGYSGVSSSSTWE